MEYFMNARKTNTMLDGPDICPYCGSLYLDHVDDERIDDGQRMGIHRELKCMSCGLPVRSSHDWVLEYVEAVPVYNG